MTAAEQEWIDQSLARLEELHTQREQVEAAGMMDKLAEIDEEIASLTEVLETVAEASGPINVAANAPVAAAPFVPQGGTAPQVPVAAPAQQPYLQAPPMGTAPQPVAAPQPFAAPQPVAAPPQAMGYPGATAPQTPGMTAPQQPFAGPGMTAPNPAVGGMPEPQPMMMSDYGDMDDVEYKSNKTPIIIVALLLVVGGGVGAFFAFGTKEAPPPAPTEPQETKVIAAPEVVEDNSDLDVAKGADVERTPERELNGSGSDAPKRTGNGGGGGGGNKRSGKKSSKGDDGRNLDLGKSRDPLSGV